MNAAMGRRGLVIVGLGLGLGLAGCGGGGDPDPAAAECVALERRICDRVVECGFMDLAQDDCMDMLEQGLPQGGCDDADSVAASYSVCMDDLLSVTCDDLFPGGVTLLLPPDCANVILFEE